MLHMETDHEIYSAGDFTRKMRIGPAGLPPDSLAPSLAGADGLRYTWSGAALAGDKNSTSSTFGRVFIGDATVGMDVRRPLAANPEIDVSITGLIRHGGAETLPDFTETGLRLRDDDVIGPYDHFSRITGETAVSGYFYGPYAQEVGGAFRIYSGTRANDETRVSGVFGAKLRP